MSVSWVFKKVVEWLAFILLVLIGMVLFKSPFIGAFFGTVLAETVIAVVKWLCKKIKTGERHGSN